MSENKKTVLILCTGNSARSQMAEGILRSLLDSDKWEVFSAGTKPSIVRPEAIEVLREKNIDISAHRSKSVEEFAGSPVDYVLTVCDNAREECPFFPATARLVHHSFEDPAEVKGDQTERIDAFRRVRDAIDEYLRSEFVGLLDAS